MNRWIRDSLVDLIVLIVLFVFAFNQNRTLEIILWIYSLLLLTGRLSLLFSKYLKTKTSKTSAPVYFYQIIYALSISCLIYAKNYSLVSTWFMIWVLSSYPMLKSHVAKKTS